MKRNECLDCIAYKDGGCVSICALPEGERMIEINEEQKKVLEAAVQTFGTKHQEDMYIEEQAELITAILEYAEAERYADYIPESLTNNLIEETADVRITLEQLKIIHSGYESNNVLDSNVDLIIFNLTEVIYQLTKLTKAVLKFRRHETESNKITLIKSMAAVRICLEYIEHNYENYQKVMNEKLNRLGSNIEEVHKLHV